VQSLASHLVVADAADLFPALHEAIDRIAGGLAEQLGSFLVLELSVGQDAGRFEIAAPPVEPATTVPVLADALRRVDVLGHQASVDVRDAPDPAPPRQPPLLTAEERRRLGVLLVGVEVPPFFLDGLGRPYPLVLRRLRREMTVALQRAVFEFTTVQTSLRPEDFRALGPHRITAETQEVDAALAEVAGQIDYLLAITPTDTDIAWRRFEEAGHGEEPAFHYRPLTVDPDLVKRTLYEIPIEDVEDPTLAALFRAKRHELDRQLNLLENRGSDAFLLTSLQLFGGVDPPLVALAATVLERLDTTATETDTPAVAEPVIDAAGFAARAGAEVARYRSIDPDVATTVTVRPDVPGVLVSGGDLLIGSLVRIPESRADALIQHEIGTHVVTEFNGRAQPLKVLCVGLPGYEETQEGLAVLAEFAVGGLTRSRLATLAARVIAVDRLVAGATFVDTFRELNGRWRLRPRKSFNVTMRVFRSGGLTKDAIYLRGVDRLLGYLGDGGPVEPLLVGKLPLENVAIVEELRWRGVLQPPRLRPRWLESGGGDRLRALCNGMTVLDLVQEVAG
jgi:uncharacterized protein (TIGR02421 family)